MTNSGWYAHCRILSLDHTEKNLNQQETKMLYSLTTSSPIFGLRREIDRLFEDTFARDGNAWTPAVDIKENDNEIRVELELPGMKPEDVEITADNGVLSIRGEKRTERKEGQENRYHVVERTYGSFMRTFQLPQGIDEDQINADFENGVLSLRIPKAALPQPKRIQIGATGQKQQAQVGTGGTSNQQSSAKNSGRNVNSQRDRENEKVAAQSR
ncbi:MAG: Hsp20/alpha crystallin family protein [Gemmatimonadaceae bacterium]